MEALKNNTVGYAVAAVGAIVAIAGGFADTLGIGAEGADGLGGKQLALLLVGLVILAAGLAVVFLSGQEGEPADDAGTADAADDVAAAEATDEVADTDTAEAETEATPEATPEADATEDAEEATKEAKEPADSAD